ncbi:MAG TPA: carboxypeptidase-like regulatory domain-containing protein [Myxococcaceae bacterium]
MPQARPRWTIPGRFVDYHVVQGSEVSAEDPRPRASDSTIRGLLETWLDSPYIADRLFALCGVAGERRAPGLRATERRRRDDRLRRRLLEAFQRGRLVALEVRQLQPKLPEKEEEPPPPPMQEEATEKLDFIALEMKDEDGEPMAYARYVVELPDGGKREGRLNANGYARIDGVNPGQCKVTFPDYDESSWS